MTKLFGLSALIMILFMSLPLYAGEDSELPKGLLSFTIEPGKFFQVGTSDGQNDESAGEGVSAGKDDLSMKLSDISAFVSFALFGLFRYESLESTPDTFDMPGAFVRGEGEWDSYRISIMTNAAVSNALTWAYIDLRPGAEKHEDSKSEEGDKKGEEKKKQSDKFALRLGIFAVPFGQQMQTFLFDLGSIDYSLIVEDITNVVGIYDMGAMIHGRFDIQDGGLTYALAVLNGEYAGTRDTNEAKSFASRIGLEFSPYAQVGTSYYKGKSTDFIWMYDTEYERAGVDLKWKPGNFKIRGEYIASIEDPESHYSGTPSVFNRGKRERTEGWWVNVGVFAWVNKKISEKYERRGLEIYAHYQGFLPPPDPLMKAATGHNTRTQFVYGLGCNFHLSRNVKLQALWQHFDLGRYNLGQFAGFKPGRHNDKIILQLAVAVF